MHIKHKNDLDLVNFKKAGFPDPGKCGIITQAGADFATAYAGAYTKSCKKPEGAVQKTLGWAIAAALRQVTSH